MDIKAICEDLDKLINIYDERVSDIDSPINEEYDKFSRQYYRYQKDIDGIKTSIEEAETEYNIFKLDRPKEKMFFKTYWSIEYSLLALAVVFSLIAISSLIVIIVSAGSKTEINITAAAAIVLVFGITGGIGLLYGFAGVFGDLFNDIKKHIYYKKRGYSAEIKNFENLCNEKEKRITELKEELNELKNEQPQIKQKMDILKPKADEERNQNQLKEKQRNEELDKQIEQQKEILKNYGYIPEHIFSPRGINYWSIELRKLRDVLYNGRAENIKEALNIMHRDEVERKHMEKLENEEAQRNEILKRDLDKRLELEERALERKAAAEEKRIALEQERTKKLVEIEEAKLKEEKERTSIAEKQAREAQKVNKPSFEKDKIDYSKCIGCRKIDTCTKMRCTGYVPKGLR